jgi:hypothetical protein
MLEANATRKPFVQALLSGWNHAVHLLIRDLAGSLMHKLSLDHAVRMSNVPGMPVPKHSR